MATCAPEKQQAQPRMRAVKTPESHNDTGSDAMAPRVACILVLRLVSHGGLKKHSIFGDKRLFRCCFLPHQGSCDTWCASLGKGAKVDQGLLVCTTRRSPGCQQASPTEERQYPDATHSSI